MTTEFGSGRPKIIGARAFRYRDAVLFARPQVSNSPPNDEEMKK